MDLKCRNLYRNYLQSLDVLDHAKVLSHGVRSGTISRDDLALAALFYFEPARIILREEVKSTSLIWFGKKIPNDTICNAINGLEFWNDIYTEVAFKTAQPLISSMQFSRRYIGYPTIHERFYSLNALGKRHVLSAAATFGDEQKILQCVQGALFPLLLGEYL